MHKFRVFRFTAAVLILSAVTSPAFAVNKDMVQLQTQVQQLLDAVARLQQSNDERMGVLKDLVQQNADSVNRMSVTVENLQKQVIAQQTAQGGKIDQVSGQIQALNDSLDEVKARMNRLEKALNDVQSTQQTMNANIQNLPQQTTAQPSGPAPVMPVTSPGVAAPPTVSTRTTAAPPLVATKNALPAPLKSAAPPVDDLYKAAFNDFMAARYNVASAEFNDVIKAYPDSALAGNSYYYLGEIDYRAGKYTAAAKDYDKVLEQYPDNNKIPASHLHKGQALIELKQNEAGYRELRALIQRFPSSPEATQARSKLNALGVPIKPRV